ncbi:biopolymer transporter ExbD [Flavobacterium sp. Sd200]|uniref:ExbD/TolR family protein n=1 Tax=Flavobacterium sp. Sd200 TaxID=2692211 RepID=UPI00136DFD9B|nr:biopolymer transporter ExbD [Flavobacterium sp. Sd200]MXN92891.1 biopolymer transporter ExbD [Flavobacterium sp. Sd200]
MAKHKVSRKSTRIDMTAMCDVAFLLLSFFVMTATAKQPEPKPVDTPASTVIDKLPEEGVATITIGDKEAFFTIPRASRRGTLERVSQEKGVSFTEAEMKTFESMDGFGVPLNQLKGLLRKTPAVRNTPGVQKGIPYDSINNELAVWIKQAREAHKAIYDAQLQEGKITTEEFGKKADLGIAIKGDAKEDFMTVKRVIDILQEQKKNRFFLVTGLRNKDF